MLKRIVTFFAAMLLISGCSTLQTSAHNPLIGDWKSTTSNATIHFDERRVSGSDGCNRYGSSYTTSGDTLIISDKMMSTMMMCEEERMKKADQFRQSLLETKHYRNDGNNLLLLNGSGALLGEFTLIPKRP